VANSADWLHFNTFPSWRHSTTYDKVLQYLEKQFSHELKCPSRQIAEQGKNAQETLGFQKKIVQKIPPGGEENPSWLIAYSHCIIKTYQHQQEDKLSLG